MIPSILLFSLPLTIRLLYVIVLFSLGIVPIFSMVDLFVGSMKLLIQIKLYNRKHKLEKVFIPDVKQMAEKMGLKNYNKPINITDNPSIKSPFMNITSGVITLPSHFQKTFKLHKTEVIASLAHELGHVKIRRAFIKEVLLVSFVIIVISFLIEAINPIASIFAELAIMMLLFPYIFRRNEFRADIEGAKVASPEALIAVFESLKSTYRKDEGSDTHPPLQERINRLIRLLESNNATIIKENLSQNFN